uniref:TNFR-Cys domain-containing protein n=1 Tax=Panagrellus redivivus TaxID=6233 RepID=A0A7E4W498_PANRE
MTNLLQHCPFCQQYISSKRSHRKHTFENTTAMRKSLFVPLLVLTFAVFALGCEDNEFDENGTCKKCHERCVGCSGPQYYLGPGGCKMCTVAQKHIFGYSECLKMLKEEHANATCQNLEFHYFEEAADDDEEVVHGYCKECHGLCAQKKGCVGPRVDQCLGCELAGMKHGELHHCLRKCPPSHPNLNADNVCQKKPVFESSTTPLPNY